MGRWARVHKTNKTKGRPAVDKAGMNAKTIHNYAKATVKSPSHILQSGRSCVWIRKLALDVEEDEEYDIEE